MSINAMTTALVIGRFQPFHLGHKKGIEFVLDEVDGVVVGVGSSQESGTLKNPFSFDERKEMIEHVFPDSKINVIAISDINDPPNWVAHVDKLVPDYQVVYTNALFERELFLAAGKEIGDIPFFQREVWDGSRIRQMMIKEEEWKSLLPKEVVKVVVDCDGVKRLQSLSFQKP